jgi:hypothetical protein
LNCAVAHSAAAGPPGITIHPPRSRIEEKPVIHRCNRRIRRLSNWGASTIFAALGVSLLAGPAPAGDLEPPTPAAFLPGGLLGVQLGGSWEASKHSPALQGLDCQPIADRADDFDEVCYFKTSAASRVGGAEIHDGFIVRQADRVVLIGTGISIKNADDPLAESVMQSFRQQVHSAFQHTGDVVLFVKLPQSRLSADQLRVYSRNAPALLVQLEPTGNELAVFYGYLAPVNAFGALTAD